MIERFRRIRLRTKLIASYVVLSVAITSTSLAIAHGFQRSLLETSQYRADVIHHADQLLRAAYGAAQANFSFVADHDPRHTDAALSLLDRAREQTRIIGSWRMGDEERRLLTTVELALDQLQTQTRAMQLERAADNRSTGERSRAYQVTIDYLGEVVAEFRVAARAQTDRELDAARRRADRSMILLGLLAIAGGSGAGILFGRRITRQLSSLRLAIKAIGEGNSKVAVPVTSKDDVGELAQDFARMVADTRRRISEYFADVFASIGESLVVCDESGVITAVNPACLQLSDHDKPADLVGRPVSDLFPAAVLAAPDSVEDEPTRLLAERESTIRKADGRSVPVRLSVSRLRGQRRHGWILVARDLSEQNRLENELRQAQKMEAIGRLAGGVAHDFNNMLSVIVGHTTMLLEDTAENDPRHDSLSDILTAGERSAELTQQLLAFSRREAMETRIVDVNETITNTSRMIRRVVGEDIELSTSLAGQACNIRIEPGQLEHILMNMVVNSRDAMPHGGRIRIETTVADMRDGSTLRHETMLPGRYVLIAVSDNGIGMDRATQERIFEPFFTTKEQGKGTGLGLSTVFGIVNQHGGHIYVYSEPGVGTTFKLYFPHSSDAADVSVSRMLPVASLRGSETILVIEDETQVRHFIHEILRRAGYRVLSARGPEEGILLSQQHDGFIHLLLTDVIMPGMNGRQVAERVLAARPDIKVVYMSGYTENVVLDWGIGAAAFLQKPITADTLRRKVRVVLDRAN